jgi:hypothetical protein
MDLLICSENFYFNVHWQKILLIALAGTYQESYMEGKPTQVTI